MNRFAIFGAVGATLITLAGCTPEEEVITKTEAEVQLDETVAPPAPEAASGPVEPSNSLNGVYNLRTTECGQAASEGALTIQGNQFQFYESQCTAVRSTVGADSTETELSCNGEGGQGFNRLVNLRLSPGVMQLEEKGINLRYFRCAAPA
ncbi:hypothetical protein [Paracoccus xiamenensis]|uniref:hypothetical protein n=1 Tax=Paracoccus xiamenensis TaxID=2714901 RepID=UPI00140D4B78|nr:hypothetical protein [Paracoccus xiamenensis]NHF71803.1 hypothetical protein [Paracoccus xiamenensis]